MTSQTPQRTQNQHAQGAASPTPGALRPEALWAEFTELLNSASSVFAWEGLELDDLDRAEGLRYLARLTENAIANMMSTASPKHPRFRLLSNGFGMDNPDNHYLGAPVDARYTYRVTGNVGRLSYLSFAAQNQNYAQREAITGGADHIDASQLITDSDGAFAITASADERPGNWLRLAPDTTLLLVRQTRADPTSERWVDIGIENLDVDMSPPPLRPDRIQHKLQAVALYTAGAANWFVDWVRPWLATPNQTTLSDPAEQQRVGGDPRILSQSGYWTLAPDEALVVRFVPPPCDYWNFQLANIWAECLDARRPIWRNNATAQVDEDGSVTLVIAHADPGHPNWLDTAGHRHGLMHARFVNAAENRRVTCQIVDFGSIASDPSDTSH
ncbi:MAG: DUF1214 domain-containing protein [Acidimicrobiia bacterium]|nr:DUF1214 domain-containing protein [Acidimicrobiia bacterium]